MKGIKEIKEEAENIIAEIRGEAINRKGWEKRPDKKEEIDRRIRQLQIDFQELETDLEKNNSEISKRVDWIDPANLEEEAIRRGMYSAKDYKKALENQKPDDLPDDWKQQIAEKNRYLQERDERPNITIKTWNDYKNRPTLDQYESRPNISIENYNHLLSNQKSADYDNIKKEKERALKDKRIIEEEKNKIENLLKETREKLTEEKTQLQQQVFDLQRQLEDALKNKKPESSFPAADTKSKTEEKIQKELDKFNGIKIEEISDDECSNLLNKFKTMKKWRLAGSDKKSEAAINKRSELNEITNKLSLENNRRNWKHKIDYALKDKKDKDEYEEDEVGEQEEHLKHTVLKNTDLTEPEYIDYEITLREKTSKTELDNFGNKVLIDIYEQRPKHKYIIEVLNWGKQAVENEDINLANEVLADLEFIKKIERQVFNSKIVEVNRLKNEINSLKSQQAQIIKTGK